jgi:hypothetical protein
VAREFEHLIASLRAFLLEVHTEEGRHTIDDQSVNFVPIGFGMPFFGSTPPRGWLLCNGFTGRPGPLREAVHGDRDDLRRWERRDDVHAMHGTCF